MAERLCLTRKLQICMVAADVHSILSKLILENISLDDITFDDLLTVRFWIKIQDLDKLQHVAEKSGVEYRVVKRKGMLWHMHTMIKRPVIMIGLICFFIACAWLPGRILFVEVEGNQIIPDKYVLENARSCGITFGSKRKDIRSEKTKNELLSKIPKLQWVGVNTSGCVARILVKEGSREEKTQDTMYSVSSIVASRDGVVDDVSVLRGTSMCEAGQSVKCGDVLISGYTDCGLKTIAELAQGEVYGYTNRNLVVIATKPTSAKRDVLGKSVALRLRIGKKLIKIWNDSGISNGTCDKMYLEEYWTLPGGFQLPISLIKEVTVYYKPTDFCVSEPSDWLSANAESYLKREMVAGIILSKNTVLSETEMCSVLYGDYDCYEMIGKVIYEETLQEDAKDN